MLCTSTTLRRSLLAHVRCWWFRIQLSWSVTHIKTLVRNALSSLKLPAFSRHSMSGRRAQRQQGTAASQYRDTARVPLRAWTAQRSQNTFDSKLTYPPALSESGKGLWPAAALSWLRVAIIQPCDIPRCFTAGNSTLQGVSSRFAAILLSRDYAVLERPHQQNCKHPFSEAQLRFLPCKTYRDEVVSQLSHWQLYCYKLAALTVCP